jgi:hypothetical protein
MVQAVPSSTAAPANATWKPEDLRGRNRARSHGAVKEARRAIRGEAREDGQPDRPPDLLAGVEQSGCEPGIFGLHVRRAEQGDGDECQPQSERHWEEADEKIGDVLAVHRELGEHDHSRGRERESDQEHPANAETRHELARDTGAHRDPCRQRKERNARAQRAVPEDLLQIERNKEEGREHRG